MSNSELEKEINQKVSKLVSKANSFDRLEEFFEKDKRINPYYKQAVEECIRDNCYGVATMMIVALEKMLDRLEDLDDYEE